MVPLSIRYPRFISRGCSNAFLPSNWSPLDSAGAVPQSTPKPPKPPDLIELAFRKLASLGLQKLQVFQLLPVQMEGGRLGVTKTGFKPRAYSTHRIGVLPNEKFWFGIKEWSWLFFGFRIDTKFYAKHMADSFLCSKGKPPYISGDVLLLMASKLNCTWWLYQLWHKIATSTPQIEIMFFVFFVSSGHRLSKKLWLSTWHLNPKSPFAEFFCQTEL